MVPLVSQYLRYAVLSSPSNENLTWYKEAKKAFFEYDKLDVFHLDANKQVAHIIDMIRTVRIRQDIFNKGRDGLVIRLTPPGKGGIWPSVSPGGKSIAYSHNSIEEGGGIYLINSDGYSRRKLIKDGLYPSWSPEADEIAYIKNSMVRVIKVDGTSERTISPSSISNEPPSFSYPSWSPDGKQIIANYAYWIPESFVDSLPGEEATTGILIVDAVKGGVKRLLSKASSTDISWIHHQGPIFSPDGQKVIYSSQHSLGFPSDKPDIYGIVTMDIDGLNPKKLIDGGGFPIRVSPKDGSIVFGDAVSQIIKTAKPSGINPKTLFGHPNLLSHVGFDIFPDWTKIIAPIREAEGVSLYIIPIGDPYHTPQ